MGKRQRFSQMRRYIEVYRLQAAKAQASYENVIRDHQEAVAGIHRALGLHRIHDYEPGFDPYDILDQIEVQGEHWVWVGNVNGHGSAAVYPYSEGRQAVRKYRGAATVVHQIVRGCQHQKAYHAQCGVRLCVRPSHRCGTCHTEAHPR